MKKIKGIRSSGMPMLELVITIGVFLIVSVFVIQLFLAGDNLRSRAKDVSKAVILSERIAETIKGTENMEKATEMLGLQPAAAFLEAKEDGTYQLNNIELIEDKNNQRMERSSDKETFAYVMNFNEHWELTKEKAVYCALVIPKVAKEEMGATTEADIYDIYDIYVYRLKEYISVQMKEGNKVLYHLHMTDYKRK